jgi:hypothetical protein
MSRSTRRLVEGTRVTWPAGVPSDARYRETFRNEGCVSGELLYACGGLQVTWSLDGALLFECPVDPRGLRHGLEIWRGENGAVEWQVRWVRGSMHGSAMQFSNKRRVLYRSPFVRGAGVDLWIQGSEIVELREIEQRAPRLGAVGASATSVRRGVLLAR